MGAESTMEQRRRDSKVRYERQKADVCAFCLLTQPTLVLQDPTGAQTSVVRNATGLQLYLRKWPAKGAQPSDDEATGRG